MRGNVSWVGLLAGVVLLVWSTMSAGLQGTIVNAHSLVMVLGGVVCAALINYPLSEIIRALGSLFSIMLPSTLPSYEQIAAEMLRLAEIARAQGWMLALQNEGGGFAGGFLNRAILVAIAAGETKKARDILDGDIRQKRILQQESGNLFRTLGTLAPMFGLMGTLFGIIMVLRNMTDPTKVGAAMAVAITASLYGIALANLVFIPIAGNIRVRALQEAQVREAIVDGVLEMMDTPSLYVLELRMGSYTQQTAFRARAAEAPPA